MGQTGINRHNKEQLQENDIPHKVNTLIIAAKKQRFS
jgi:hypothetical protein